VAGVRFIGDPKIFLARAAHLFAARGGPDTSRERDWTGIDCYMVGDRTATTWTVIPCYGVAFTGVRRVLRENARFMMVFPGLEAREYRAFRSNLMRNHL
jgi:hypothetical protein